MVRWGGTALVAVLCVMVVGLLIAKTWFPHRPINSGFGPEWQCTHVYRAGPICIKQSQAR